MIFLLAVLTLLAVSLYKTYHSVATKELKRRAQKGDDVAKLLYGATVYDVDLRILLWIIIGLSASGFFVLLSRSVPVWVAFCGSAILLWLGFAWLPNSRITFVGDYIARLLTPVIAKILDILQPILNRVKHWLRYSGHIVMHTGLYQKEDVLDLLAKQRMQLDNRITEDEIRIASGALTFSDKLVGSVMIPARIVKMVADTDVIGPVIMDELHKSGHSRFPVYRDTKSNIVGVLYLRDVINAKSGGHVSKYMSQNVYYVKEDKQLGHVLQAFLKTKHHLFIVVNSFEEVVGMITLEDVVEQIIGKPILDEFDQYEDLRAVAFLDGIVDHKQHNHL